MVDGQNDAIFSFRFKIPENAIDENGHVNNVMYVQWMQDAAVRHFESLGGAPLMAAARATWVVRSHRVEYLSPAFADEEIEARTWIANVRRVRSMRKYEFLRPSDGKLLVKGETDWVFVDAQDGRPVAIPESILNVFSLLPDPRD